MIININLTTKDDIPDTNLVVIVGKNNAGKSRLLKRWRDTFDKEADYIPPNRFNIQDRVSDDVESELQNQRTTRRSSHYPLDSNISEFPQPETFLELVNLDDADREILINWHNKYFDELKIVKQYPQKEFSKAIISINNKKANFAGSGSRAVLGLLSRLFDPTLDTIFIDEPEIGLEPRIQKKLFELIKKISKGEESLKKKKIILTTHSNLFLDKEDINNNWKMEKIDEESGNILFSPISTEAELLNTSFDLLGANPSDLFFPNNILIVEGPSDQKFISKILELKYPGSKISVHFSEGIGKIGYAIPAIEQMLKSLAYLPIYKERICVIIDQDTVPKVLPDWQNFVNDVSNDRIIELCKNGIEYFYPMSILSFLTGIEKSELDLSITEYINQEKISHDRKANLGSLNGITKIELAEKIVGLMSSSHLLEIDTRIINLVDKCFSLKVN